MKSNSNIVMKNTKETQDPDYWTCDACGGDSESGCQSSTGECYR